MCTHPQEVDVFVEAGEPLGGVLQQPHDVSGVPAVQVDVLAHERPQQLVSFRVLLRQREQVLAQVLLHVFGVDRNQHHHENRLDDPGRVGHVPKRGEHLQGGVRVLVDHVVEEGLALARAAVDAAREAQPQALVVHHRLPCLESRNRLVTLGVLFHNRGS